MIDCGVNQQRLLDHVSVRCSFAELDSCVAVALMCLDTRL